MRRGVSGVGRAVIPIYPLVDVLHTELIGQRGDTSIARARAHGDKQVDTRPHQLGQLLVLLIADAARDEAHIRFGYLKQRLTDVKDCYLAAPTYGKPLLRDFYSHSATSSLLIGFPEVGL